MLRYKTELASFSRLVHHPPGKRSGSILTTPEPARQTDRQRDDGHRRFMPPHGGDGIINSNNVTI